jgi:hypothetical protein
VIVDARPIKATTASQKELRRLFHAFAVARDGFAEALSEIVPKMNEIQRIADSQVSIAWPPLPCPAQIPTWRPDWPDQYRALDDIGRLQEHFGKKMGLLTTTLDRIQARLQNFKLNLALHKVQGSITDEDYTRQLNAATSLEKAVEDLHTRIAATWTELAQVRRTAGRWNRIIQSNPEPIIQQNFLIDRRSKRYTIGILRTPLTEVAKGHEEKPPDEGSKVSAITIASFSYESHAPHRFNVSLGLAGLWRGDDKEFGIQSSPDGSGGVEFKVQETDSATFELEPVALLGIYFRGVDNYDRTRKPALMLNIGTEISTSPEDFLLGAAVDFRSGLVLGAGLTYYEKTELAKGWEIGQTVPSISGEPVIDAVPTKSDDDIGYYITIAFRPAIFKAFWSQAKK